MYTFSKRLAGRFDIFASFQRQGDTHLKKFSAGVTPQTQATVNVYAKGSFSFQVGDFEQVMSEGSCTLDLGIAEFPEGLVATETVLSPYALRYCVSPSSPGPFTRAKVDVAEGQSAVFDVNTLVFVLAGRVSVAGVSVAQGGYVVAMANSPVTGSATLLAVA